MVLRNCSSTNTLALSLATLGEAEREAGGREGGREEERREGGREGEGGGGREEERRGEGGRKRGGGRRGEGGRKRGGGGGGGGVIVYHTFNVQQRFCCLCKHLHFKLKGAGRQ